MKLDLSKWGPATVLVVACVLIAVAAGGVITIVHPDTLAFDQYLDALKTFAVAAGILGVGRGIHLAGASAQPDPQPAQLAPGLYSTGEMRGDAASGAKISIGRALVPDEPPPLNAKPEPPEDEAA